MNLRQKLEELKAELRSVLDSAKNAKDEELDKLMERSDALEKEIESVRKKIKLQERAQRMALEGEDGEDGGEGEGGENEQQRSRTVKAPGAAPSNTDPYATEEYRKAFMEFCCRGKEIPAKYRANATTATADAGAVIPTTILNEMVVQLKTYGNLYSRVRKLNVQGGIQIPITSLKPTATWISADTATSQSDTQKIQANTSVTFSYYGLECKVSQTLLVNVVTLDMFQEQFTTLAVEAITKALDTAIISGTGSGQPLGITKDSRVPTGQIVTLSPTDVGKWGEWKKKVFAKIPPAYRNGSFIMAQGTFDGYIDGMVDTTNQPIARVNYGIDNGETYRFGGKEVLIVESDIIKDWDSATGHASTGDVVAVFCNLNDYAINSNMDMRVDKWFDYDKNEIKNKVIMIADGKLVDPNGVVIVKKGAAS